MNERGKPQRRSAQDAQSDTRAALLGAARSCVAEHGLAGTTSRMIATTAGANLASITYYFGGKDELMGAALFGELSARVEPVLDLLENGEQSAATRLANAVQTLLVDFEAARGDLPVFLHALMESAAPGAFGQQGRRLLASLQERLAAVLADLNGRGLIASWVDPDPMAALIIATAQGAALHAHLHPDGPPLADLAAQLSMLLLSAATPTAFQPHNVASADPA